MNEIELLNKRMERHLRAKGHSSHTLLAKVGLSEMTRALHKPSADRGIFISDKSIPAHEIMLRKTKRRASQRRSSLKFESKTGQTVDAFG